MSQAAAAAGAPVWHAVLENGSDAFVVRGRVVENDQPMSF